MNAPSPRLFLREARAYLKAAKILHEREVRNNSDLAEWEIRNPIYFLLLHATELALKSVGFSRKKNVPRSHDIVKIARKVSERSDRKHIRYVYKAMRELSERRIHEKRERYYNEFYKGSDLEINEDYKGVADLEIEEKRHCSVGLIYIFKLLGALGETELVKYEFGKKVENWWHAARYPRVGSTDYPDIEYCFPICEKIIQVAELEVAEFEMRK